MLYGTVNIRDKLWNVSVATTPGELAQGLGGLAGMPAGSGMLFDLSIPVSYIAIDMSRMLFPLDIVFMGSDGRVLGVMTGVYPGETGVTFASDMGIRYFLEVNNGETAGIVPGEVATITISSPVTNWTSMFSAMMPMIMIVMMMGMLIPIIRGMFEKPKEKRLELSPQTTKPRSTPPWRPEAKRRVVLSSLIHDELTAAGLGYVAKEVSAIVEKRARDNEWLDLWDGTTFDRVGGYPEHIGLTVPRLIAAEIGIRTRLSYDQQVKIAEGIDEKLKVADTIVLDDGSTFQKSYVPVRKESLPQIRKSRCKVGDRIKSKVWSDVRGGHPWLTVKGIYTSKWMGKQVVELEVTDGIQTNRVFEDTIIDYESIPQGKVIPIKKSERKAGDLEYLADSPEFLALTITDIGYRDKIDNTFQEAIARAKGLK